jgi:predicted ATPase
MEVEYLEYSADNNTIRMERASKRQSRKAAEYDLRAVINGRHDYLRRTPGRVWPLPPPVKCYGFPDEVSAYFQNSGFTGDLELEFDRQFTDRLYYLGPLRSAPLRQYQWKGTHPDDVGDAGNRAIEALLASRDMGRRNARKYDSRGRATRRITVEEHVAEWLRELRLVESFEVERLAAEADIYRVRVRQTAQSTLVLLTDVGFGVSQILPVLVLLAYVPEGSTVMLEQPEIHLHPAVQSGLADIILEASRIRNVQVIVESHSEHLLRRLQLRVAEGVNPEALSLYFCSAEGGESRINELSMNLLGEIDNWPNHFFGDPLGETAAIARAALQRISPKSGS